MNTSDEERYRILKNKHQQLYADWKRNHRPCIICGEEEGNEDDHLPPKVLYPKKLRSSKTYFFTFPVCSNCNRGSSDEDFLFSVFLSIGLNQDVYFKNEEPTNPDLLALHQQTMGHLQNSPLATHRRRLLQDYIGKDPTTGRDAINVHKLPINGTTTKIVKSIYWLHTGGDILRRYNPGWWIRRAVDASKENFIEKHLKITHSDILWDDKFISHYSIGLPKSGADGFISCSLHFYSNRSVKKGMTWYLIASPVTTKISNKSLFDICASKFGNPTTAPTK